MKRRNVFWTLGVAMAAAAVNGATLYRTTADAPFRVRDCTHPSTLTGAGANVIDLDAAVPRHEFLGLGVSFAEASAYLLANQTEAKRREILELLWTPRGAGLSIGRIHIGSSDYSMRFYTYDDVPGDDALAHFSIDEDLPMYVTEMGPHIDHSQRDMNWWADLVLGTFNAGCGAFVSWCFLLDEEGQPNTSLGFPCAGLLEIDSRTGELYESGQFRFFRHVGPFVKRGARVLEAPIVPGQGQRGLEAVASAAFRNPDGSRVVVLAFRGRPFARRQVQVKADGLYYPIQVLANSVTTLVLP